MNQITFTSNPNGKLSLDVFTDIRQANMLKFAIANEIEVVYKNKVLGTAVVEAYKCLRLNEINDVIAYANCGKQAFYQGTLIKKFYGSEVGPEYPLMIVVLRYVSRNWDAHADMMMTSWNSRVERHNAPSKYLIKELP